jgi:hypothetical protein
MPIPALAPTVRPLEGDDCDVDEGKDGTGKSVAVEDSVGGVEPLDVLGTVGVEDAVGVVEALDVLETFGVSDDDGELVDVAVPDSKAALSTDHQVGSSTESALLPSFTTPVFGSTKNNKGASLQSHSPQQQ